MPDSHPPIYDDGGGLPEVKRSAPSDDHEPGGDVEYFSDMRPPNFLIRRALAVGAAVAVVAVAAVGVGKLLSNDGDGSSTALSSADWNTIVSVDNAAGTIVLTDANGEETDRFRLGVQPLTAAQVAGPTVVATSRDTVAVVSLDDTANVTTVEFETATPLLMPSGSALTLIAHDPAAQRAVFVHGPTGDMVDTGTVDTIAGARYDLELARSDPAGRNVLVTDSGNFQSVLFSFDRDEPSFFPGLALAVDGDHVVTAQNVGTDATVAVFDHEGEPGVSARTASVRAGMVVDGGVVLVTVDGEVLLMSLANGDVDDVSSLTIGTVESGHVNVRGNRLVVIGELGTAIVDDSGLVLAELIGATPTTTGVDEVAPRRIDCLIAQRQLDGEVVVVDYATGMILAEAIANPNVLAGVNGCEPVVPTSAGYLVITADGVLRATVDGDVEAVSPDGRTIVADNNNRLELLPRAVEDNVADDTEPVDVGRGRRSVFFADL